MSGQTVPHIEFLQESTDFYGQHTPPPFTYVKAKKFPVQLVSDGTKQLLGSWTYRWPSGNLFFSTLRLNNRIYIVKALPEDFKYGDAMNSCDGCPNWFVWQGTRQLFIGNQFNGPVATTYVGPEPASRIAVQPAQQKRTNADEVPIPSKRVRFVVSPSPNRTISERDPSPTNPCAPSWSPVTPEKQTAISDHNESTSSSDCSSLTDLSSDLSSAPPSPALACSTDFIPERQVDPLLVLKAYPNEKTPLPTHLSDVQDETASHGTVALQNFFERIDNLLLLRSGKIHTLEAAFVKGAVSVANVPKGGNVQILDRIRICCEVKTALESFLALVQQHEQLFRSNLGYITLTAVKTYAVKT